MKLVFLVPTPDGKEIMIEQEFDRTITVQLFEAAAAQCKLMSNSGLVFNFGAENFGLRPLRGTELVKPNGFSMPFSSRIADR